MFPKIVYAIFVNGFSDFVYSSRMKTRYGRMKIRGSKLIFGMKDPNIRGRKRITPVAIPSAMCGWILSFFVSL